MGQHVTYHSWPQKVTVTRWNPCQTRNMERWGRRGGKQTDGTDRDIWPGVTDEVGYLGVAGWQRGGYRRLLAAAA